jgi:hypothetical protein
MERVEGTASDMPVRDAQNAAHPRGASATCRRAFELAVTKR